MTGWAWATLAACLLALPSQAARGVLQRAEAEDYCGLGGGEVRVIDRAEASGGKSVSYWEQPGVYLELAVELPEAGDYLLSLRYALDWPDSRRTVAVDGRELGVVTLAGTGSWGTFREVTLALKPVALTAGRHVLRLLNADSRGLSLDWVAVHSPDVLLTDRVLTEPERTALLAALAPAEPGPVLSKAGVRVEFDADGRAALARLGEVVLATPPGGAGGRVELKQTASHAVAVVTGRGTAIWLTDGRSLWLVTLGDAAMLPAPVLYGQRRAVVGRFEDGREVSFAAPFTAPEPCSHSTMAGLHLTAAAGLAPDRWPAGEEPGVPRLRLVPTRLGDLPVAAARFSARWGKDEPKVGLTVADGRCTVTEVAHRYPALSAFYGEPPFELRITPSGSVTYRDPATGQEQVLVAR